MTIVGGMNITVLILSAEPVVHSAEPTADSAVPRSSDLNVRSWISLHQVGSSISRGAHNIIS